MKYIALIKNSNTFSLSPLIFKKAFELLQLDYRHAVLNIGKNELATTINYLRKDFILGANVTIPHKESVIKFLDEISDEAKITGAVNTIANKNGKLIGYNTDIYGIKNTLEPFKDRISGENILVIGAGGASRAVIVALAKYFNPSELLLYNRTTERANILINEFAKSFPNLKINLVTTLAQVNPKLIVNATSVGMSPKIYEMPITEDFHFSSEQIFFDIVYNPIETKLLKHAKHSGATVLNGVEMFVHQAAKSFEIWTGNIFPINEAREVVIKSFNKK
ncbi:MAG: shikimate dehydrogenase [Bacteroidota bacterium]